MLLVMLLVNCRLFVVKSVGSQKLDLDFKLCDRWAPLTPTLFKSQLYLSNFHSQVWRLWNFPNPGLWFQFNLREFGLTGVVHFWGTEARERKIFLGWLIPHKNFNNCRINRTQCLVVCRQEHTGLTRLSCSSETGHWDEWSPGARIRIEGPAEQLTGVQECGLWSW